MTAGMSKPKRPRLKKLVVPQGPQSVVPDPQMAELRQILSRIEGKVEVAKMDAVVAQEAVASFAHAVLARVVVSPQKDVVLALVAARNRDAIVQLIDVLYGEGLDVAAFALANIKREWLNDKLDDDAWFRTRLRRAVGLEKAFDEKQKPCRRPRDVVRPLQITRIEGL